MIMLQRSMQLVIGRVVTEAYRRQCLAERADSLASLSERGLDRDESGIAGLQGDR